MSQNLPLVTENPWQALRRFTDARIALGRAGVSLPTAAHLDFQLAHAMARDAVHHELDVASLAPELDAAWPMASGSCLRLHSAAADRGVYLRHPELGRRLDDASRERLRRVPRPAGEHPDARPYDLAFVIADGLSALAIEQNALPLLGALRPQLSTEAWSIAPLCIVEQGRVAIGDEVAELLGARAVVVLIGERPGLSSPDSLGLYLTWMPRVGLTDERRNCISNVRLAGLRHDEAARSLHALLTQSRARQLSGVGLKISGHVSC